MSTNGLYQWVDQVMDSYKEPPFYISDINLSQDNSKLIVFYSIRNNESQV